MTDKEQIIVDGVDVSGCVSFDKCNGKNLCCCDDTREDKIPFANFCVENKDCYYKQLIRKTQECEELKEKLMILDEEDIVYEITENEFNKMNAYRKTLQEIEEYCKEQNLKYDTTACIILDIINKVKDKHND